MLLYKEGQFHISGVSFAIPENYYLVTNPGIKTEEGMLLYSPDREYTVEFSAGYEKSPSNYSLTNTLENFESIRTAAPFLNNGLSGHMVLYKTNKYAHCEIIFELVDPELNMFQVFFEFPGDFDVLSFINSEEFQRIMRCVKAA